MNECKLHGWQEYYEGMSTHISQKSILEEVINSVTHGIGAILGVIGLVLGILAYSTPLAFKVSFIVYATCLITLMAVSSLYHALSFTKAKSVFRILDHSGIFLLIAGTFTPFIVFLYTGWFQIILLILVWALCITGITLSASLPKIMKRFGVGVYIALGWLGVLFIPKLIGLPSEIIWLVIGGGWLYTIGASLLAIKKSFAHPTWHVFVVAAAVVHFVAIVNLAQMTS